VARSIGDWYADHADGSDRAGDDEFIERQYAWDTSLSNRQITARSPVGQPAAKRPFTRTGRGAALTEKQALVRAEVLAMRRRFPSTSFKDLVELLQAEGVSITRRDVAAIVNAPARPRRADRQGRAGVQKSGTTPTDQQPSRPTSATGQPPVANRSRARGAKPKNQSTTARGANRKRQFHAAQEPSRHPSRVPPSQPVKLPPMSLSLDEPAKPRRVKKAGWHRARKVTTAMSQKPAAEPVVTCNACGVVPSPLGACRCS
jgi:hypothetical protein